MKKLYKGLAAIAVALTLCFALALAACGGSSGSSGINVNFVISDSETQTVTVESGETVEAPEDPTMSGYMFSGWYADKDCTEEFDFATEITKDTNIYAGWIERKDGYVYVTYHLNYEGAGTYSVAEIENGEPLTNTPSPTRDGYRFTTWYLEAACTNEIKGGAGTGK